MTWLSTFLGGIWGYIAAFIVGGLLAFGATLYVKSAVDNSTIAALKLSAQSAQTASVTASLAKLQTFISGMDTAETGYQSTLSQILDQFAAVNKGLKNATAKPLPPDCKPDAARMQSLTAAVAATNH